MKKLIAVVFVFLISLFSFYCFAQLKEVRGVQTRAIQYDSEEGKIKHGYEFKNENNYAVWVEAELWTYGDDNIIKKEIRSTKNFNLSPGETYRWKCGDSMHLYQTSDRSGDENYKNFYVRYIAYKAE